MCKEMVESLKVKRRTHMTRTRAESCNVVGCGMTTMMEIGKCRTYANDAYGTQMTRTVPHPLQRTGPSLQLTEWCVGRRPQGCTYGLELVGICSESRIVCYEHHGCSDEIDVVGSANEHPEVC